MGPAPHQRAARAQDEGWFDGDSSPSPFHRQKKEPITVEKDEGIRRDTSLERLAKRPVFREGGP